MKPDYDLWVFLEMDSVLDAGCGFSQWSASLAGINKYITGVDIDENRIRVSKLILEHLNLNNVHLHQSKLERMPLPDESVDGGQFSLALVIVASEASVDVDAAKFSFVNMLRVVQGELNNNLTDIFFQ